jgi:hypothetical protein
VSIEGIRGSNNRDKLLGFAPHHCSIIEDYIPSCTKSMTYNLTPLYNPTLLNAVFIACLLSTTSSSLHALDTINSIEQSALLTAFLDMFAYF